MHANLLKYGLSANVDAFKTVAKERISPEDRRELHVGFGYIPFTSNMRIERNPAFAECWSAIKIRIIMRRPILS